MAKVQIDRRVVLNEALERLRFAVFEIDLAIGHLRGDRSFRGELEHVTALRYSAAAEVYRLKVALSRISGVDECDGEASSPVER